MLGMSSRSMHAKAIGVNKNNRKKIGCLEIFGFSVTFWIFWISLQMFLDFHVIFCDVSNALSNHCTVAWVTRHERPKGVKVEVKQARRAATLKSGP